MGKFSTPPFSLAMHPALQPRYHAWPVVASPKSSLSELEGHHLLVAFSAPFRLSTWSCPGLAAPAGDEAPNSTRIEPRSKSSWELLCAPASKCEPSADVSQ